jgi:hypothetical protein
LPSLRYGFVLTQARAAVATTFAASEFELVRESMNYFDREPGKRRGAGGDHVDGPPM